MHSWNFPRCTSPAGIINPFEVGIVDCTLQNFLAFICFQNAVQLQAGRRLLRRVIKKDIVQEIASRPVDLPQIGQVDSSMCFLQSSLVTEAQLGMVTKVVSELGKAILVQRQQQVCCKVPFLEPLLKKLIRVVVASRRHVVTVGLGVVLPFKGLPLYCGVARLVFDLPC